MPVKKTKTNEIDQVCVVCGAENTFKYSDIKSKYNKIKDSPGACIPLPPCSCGATEHLNIDAVDEEGQTDERKEQVEFIKIIKGKVAE